MKPTYKDLSLLFLYTMSNTVYYIWVIIYPYQASYLKTQNPSIKMKEIFTATIALFVGITIANYILPKFYFLFGIKKTMQIGGLFYLLNCIGFFFFVNKFFVFVNIMFSGTVYQFYIMSVTFFLSEKYDGGHFYINYVMVGQNIANIIWPFMAMLIINPKNIGMDLEIMENGELTNYFPDEVSKNFPMLMKSIGVISFLFTIIPTIFLEDPKHIKPVFFQYITAYFSSNKKALSEISKSFKNLKIEEKSINCISINNLETSLHEDNSELFIEENVKTEQTFKQASEKASKINKSPLLLIFVLILTIRMSPLAYILDNYKLIAFKVIKNDKIISMALSVGSMFGIIGEVGITFIYKRLDFYYTQLFLSLYVFFGLFIYLFLSVYYEFFMFGIIIYFRIALQMIYGSNYLTKFSLFSPKEAVFVSKVIDNHYLFSVIMMIFLNYLFFIGDDISTIFWVFLSLHCLTSVLLFWFFKDFKNYVKNL